MLFSPDDIALRIQYEHRPGWLVWYGRETRQYWAMPLWIHTSGLLNNAVPDLLDAAMRTFETFYPRPTGRAG
jgi:hypothetical protein